MVERRKQRGGVNAGPRLPVVFAGERQSASCDDFRDFRDTQSGFRKVPIFERPDKLVTPCVRIFGCDFVQIFGTELREQLGRTTIKGNRSSVPLLPSSTSQELGDRQHSLPRVFLTSLFSISWRWGGSNDTRLLITRNLFEKVRTQEPHNPLYARPLCTKSCTTKSVAAALLIDSGATKIAKNQSRSQPCERSAIESQLCPIFRKLSPLVSER